MIIQIGLLILGFVLLIKGADIFVDASVGIAEKLHVPKVIIGLTIVAMGTSAPEVVISVTAAMRGNNALAISNVVGSNMFNLIFIIGLCAVIKPIMVKVGEIAKDFWLSIVAAALLLAMKFIGGDIIPWWGSLMFLVIFGTYMFLIIKKALKAKHEEEAHLAAHPEDAPPEVKIRKMPVLALFAVLGCALIVAGGHLAVEGATYVATALGVSERIIGLTIIAMGTSLPELITSLVACKRGENEFALGNIIGSNIFNILFILGIAGLIAPLEFELALMFDTSVLVVSSLVALFFVYTRKTLGRIEGSVMVIFYVSYIAFVVFSQ
ncbi:MAG: calcium/sodium antiporter [Defluviitaleaceae bacterium]|nr:calcium/sodium antiporter [Defluviitaleaceae bacterium]